VRFFPTGPQTKVNISPSYKCFPSIHSPIHQRWGCWGNRSRRENQTSLSPGECWNEDEPVNRKHRNGPEQRLHYCWRSPNLSSISRSNLPSLVNKIPRYLNSSSLAQMEQRWPRIWKSWLSSRPLHTRLRTAPEQLKVMAWRSQQNHIISGVLHQLEYLMNIF